ncbi:MAG TPA: hypothetical protein VM143_09220 [Acidimicrobiales bacterium]|nr:hypothetical protein [Acidimicrobiales bacterium]
MTRTPFSPRRAAVVFGLAVAVLVGGPTRVSGQASDGQAATAIPSQDGWWNRAKGPQASEPNNPIRSTVGGAVPAPSTVPATGLGVGAAAGDPDKVAAIGLVLDAGLDPLVDSLVLTLKETAENGSNLNASSAKIAACPITAFWAGVKDGDWVNRPTCDEGQSVPGTRAADGTWTFDLTLLAMQWVDPTSGLDQNGVLLVEAVDAPMSFQVSFSDISSGKVTTAFSATPGLSGDAFGTETDESFTSTDEEFGEVAVDDGSSAGFVDDTTFAPTTGGFVANPVGRTGASAGVSAGDQVGTPVATTGPLRAANLFGDLPVVALFFLLLLVVGAALLVGLVLAPLTAPSAAVVVRSGGVSRALAERAAADADRGRRR